MIFRREPGFTLVEMMIAVVIGLLLTAGLMQFFMSDKQTYRIQDALSRVQENGRIALDFMNREVRKSGYKTNPYAANTDVFPAAGDFPINGQVVFGTDNNANGGDAVKDGSDTIEVRYLGSGTPADDWMHDCLGAALADGAMAAAALYVDISARLTCQADNGTTGLVQSQVIADGVENMQILYGIDNNADTAADVYVAANAVTNWNQVVSVRISLLLQTLDDNLASTPQIYTFNGIATTPADRRLRRVFSNVITLRNMVP